MKNVWGTFWRGSKIEWTKEDILGSESMKRLASLLKSYFKKDSLKGLNILEIGAGIGLASYFFYNRGANVTLLDSSKEAKKMAKKWWDDNKHAYVISDLFEYDDKRFDVVLSFGLCEHFKGLQRELVLKKHIELLKQKGIAVISVPYKYGIFYRIGKIIAEIAGLWKFGDEFPFSKKELIDFAESNNLNYKITFGGFYSSAYDLFIRKPFKLFNIMLKRRFDSTRSIFDFLGSSVVIILEKSEPPHSKLCGI